MDIWSNLSIEKTEIIAFEKRKIPRVQFELYPKSWTKPGKGYFS